MSDENLEVVRRGLDAFNRGDVDGFAALATHDFEWFPALPGAVEGASYRGHRGIESYFKETRETWEQLHLVAEELRDLGDRVLVLGKTKGSGRGSGAQVEAPHAFLAEFRGSKISRVRTYLDHGDALEAVSLAE